MTVEAASAAELTFRLPGGLDTPRVVVDLARVEANIARLQDEMDRRGIAVRPHAKTHKSIAVARLQLAAGARGITVGTLGEAEVFTAAGIGDVFLAYPLWAAGPKADRLRAVHDAAPGLRVGVDSAAGAERLAAAIAGGQRRPGGPDRGGSGQSPNRARRARGRRHRRPRRPGRRARGRRNLFSHGGHGYRIGAAAGAGHDEIRALDAAAAALRDGGIEIATISAGSTPTMLSAAAGAVTEMRAGTYAYGDRQQWTPRGDPGGRLRGRGRGHRRLRPRRPGRPRCRGQGADEGPGRLADGLRRDRRLSAASCRAGQRLPRRGRRPGRAGAARPRRRRRGDPEPRLPGRRPRRRGGRGPAGRRVDRATGRSTPAGGAAEAWPLGPAPAGAPRRPRRRADDRRRRPAVLAIYGQGIAAGYATFETARPGWRAWTASHRRDCRFVGPPRRPRRRLDRGRPLLVPRGLRRGRLGERLRRRRGARAGRRIGVAGRPDPGDRGIRDLDPDRGRPGEQPREPRPPRAAGFRRIGVQERIGRDAGGVWRDVFLLERRSLARRRLD